MKQEDKELLLRDLCARLPYDVIVDYESRIYILNAIDPACKDIDYITVRIQDVKRLLCAENTMIEDIKPYLRPMSSMTEEEREEYNKMQCVYGLTSIIKHGEMTDWLHAHHFDYRGLIEKGLALEAPKGMYDLQV